MAPAASAWSTSSWVEHSISTGTPSGGGGQRAARGLSHPAAQRGVVLLHQHRVEETGAVALAAARHHGLLLEGPQAWRGLARVQDSRPGPLDRPHVPCRHRGDARKPAEQVQGGALGGEDPRRAALRAQHRPALAPLALRRQPFQHDVGIGLAKGLLGRFEPEDHTGRLLGDRRPRAGPLGHDGARGQVAGADVLRERPRDEVPQLLAHPTRTVIVPNSGSLAPCRRAPAVDSSRRYSTTSAVMRSPGSSAGMPGG